MTAPQPEIVQCGWCPARLTSTLMAIWVHFAVAHGVADGSYSIRPIGNADWDVSELAGDPR